MVWENHLVISGDLLGIGLGHWALGFLVGHLSGQYLLLSPMGTSPLLFFLPSS